jgi:hypothetical protein
MARVAASGDTYRLADAAATEPEAGGPSLSSPYRVKLAMFVHRPRENSVISVHAMSGRSFDAGLPEAASPESPTLRAAKSWVICAGQFGSGSTWLFNIASRIVRLCYPESRVLGLYSDNLSDDEFRENRFDRVIIKTHIVSDAARVLSNLAGMPVLLSVRDPRDAVVSLMTRFGIDFEESLAQVEICANSLTPLAQLPNVLVLRYEDGFTKNQKTVAAVARHLERPLPRVDLEAIFADHTRETIMSLIEAVESQDRQGDTIPPLDANYETRWNPTHLGDGRVGKWREYLTEAQAARIVHETRSFRAAFGYEDEVAAVETGAAISFSQDGLGPLFFREGFWGVESWGTWTSADPATIRVPLSAPVAKHLRLTLACRLGPALLSDSTGAAIRVSVNGSAVAEISAASSTPPDILLSVYMEDAIIGADAAEIRIEADGLLSPAEMDLSVDGRRLGLGVIRLDVAFV